MEFLVSILYVANGKQRIDEDLRKELLDNATYVRRYNVWLFEGDWETWLLPWARQIQELGQIAVPCMGDMSEGAIEDVVADALGLESSEVKYWVYSRSRGLVHDK